jgi:hypothetical protein
MVGARPVIFLRHQHPHEAEVAELGDRLGCKPFLAVPLGRVRRKLRLGELTRHVSQHLLFVS